MFLSPNAFVHFWVWQEIFSGSNFASENFNTFSYEDNFLCNSNLRDIEFDVMCTPNGASVDNDSADTITMEELEEQFDSCRLGIALDSIAHIEK